MEIKHSEKKRKRRNTMERSNDVKKMENKKDNGNKLQKKRRGKEEK